MAATLAADFGFQPQVAKDHIEAYFRKKLVFGALAYQDNTLEGQGGDTIDFPFYGKIDAAEEPTETGSLTVDNLTDSSFNAVIKEVGKAVGFSKKSLMKHKNGPDGAFQEAFNQIARVHAEKVDADLLAIMQTPANYDQILTATVAGNVCTIRDLNSMRIRGFGDRMDEGVAVIMHSFTLETLLNDSTAGFLKADANDPMYGITGFQGRIFGMAIIVNDQLARVADVASLRTYECFMMKPNAVGFMSKQQPEIETDYDILARQYVITGNQWYAVRGFHKAVATDDVRLIRSTFTTAIPA